MHRNFRRNGSFLLIAYLMSARLYSARKNVEASRLPPTGRFLRDIRPAGKATSFGTLRPPRGRQRPALPAIFSFGRNRRRAESRAALRGRPLPGQRPRPRAGGRRPVAIGPSGPHGVARRSLPGGGRRDDKRRRRGNGLSAGCPSQEGHGGGRGTILSPGSDSASVGIEPAVFQCRGAPAPGGVRGVPPGHSVSFGLRS
jgi:hypothetical protein